MLDFNIDHGVIKTLTNLKIKNANFNIFNHK